MSKFIVVNFDKKEYITPEAFGDKSDLEGILTSYDNGVQTALAVLLSDGNGRGGGDLHCDSPVVGSWAGDRVAVLDELATCPVLSEPGLEDVELQKQFKKLGRDISKEVVAAIIAGEGSRSVLAGLNDSLVIPLPVQRAMPAQTLTLVSSKENRAERKVQTLEELYGLFNVSAGLSVFTGKKQLAIGLNKFAKMVGRSEQYAVSQMAYVWENKSDKNKSGLKIAAILVDEANENSTKAVVFKVGVNGSTVDKIFEQVFPGLVWERDEQTVQKTSSPFVSKLLEQVAKLK